MQIALTAPEALSIVGDVPTVQGNGCEFYYDLQGQGRDLVFIHGEIHGLEYWEHQTPGFARDHRCFAYNRRGHAKTQLPNYGFSLVNQTRDLATLIGRGGDTVLTVERVADDAGMSPYELLTGLRSRVERSYTEPPR